jgi:exoenzyme U
MGDVIDESPAAARAREMGISPATIAVPPRTATTTVAPAAAMGEHEYKDGDPAAPRNGTGKDKQSGGSGITFELSSSTPVSPNAAVPSTVSVTTATMPGETKHGATPPPLPPRPNRPRGNAVTGFETKGDVADSPRGLAFSAESVASTIRVEPANAAVQTFSFKSDKGRALDVAIGARGKVTLSAAPPSINEITFSGGGGKGAALPGAVKALEESGTLKNAKVLNGASVGSMTASLIAAGMTSKDFTEMGNDPATGAKISEGRGAKGLLGWGMVGYGLSGEGLENMMREKIGESIRKRIKEHKANAAPSAETLTMLDQIDGRLSRGGGATFGDLRTLSKIIPEIKELNVAGTYMADDSARPGQIEGKGKPQLAMFNADTEPNLDIATAVHASAALPPVFQPVNIRLASGVTARFEDGGVMNNAPTSDLVGAKRNVDPMPATGKMTFVFEGEDDTIKQGYAVPTRKRMNDYFCAAPNSAADYEKKSGLAQNSDDVVMVPLKFQAPDGTQKNFASLVNGTLNMTMPVADKIVLQGATTEATRAWLNQRKQPKATQFGSVNEMLNSVSRGDLGTMAAEAFPGAQEALEFRDAVTGQVAALENIAANAKPADLERGPIKDALDRLNQLANGNADRLAFIGRELNRSGKLDPLMTVAKKAGAPDAGALKAGVVVAETLEVRAKTQFVLREVIYPKMVRTDQVSLSAAVLADAEILLRNATTKERFNQILRECADWYREKSDVTGWHGHREFVQQLDAQQIK